MKYFAYGSNMSETKMKSLKVNYSSRERATLENYQIVFNKQSKRDINMGFANIEIKPGYIVEGILYEISDDDIIYLDRCEGFPRHYLKKDIEVIRESGEKIKCMVYIANIEKIKENLKPSKEYLEIILEGKDLLSKNYIRNLKKVNVL